MTSGPLHDFDIVCVRAANPGPMTLTGTNSWIVGREPAWVVDPGPDRSEHLDAVAREVGVRGGAGGIAVTHSHGDHADGVPGLLQRLGGSVPVGGSTVGDVRLADGQSFGPLSVLALPGHSADHLGFVLSHGESTVCFTGDAVLGEGSVFVAADMGGYLHGLERMKALGPALLCPGHGPLVSDPAAHLDAYLAHRRERERRVREAVDRGVTGEQQLLDECWGELSPRLRPAALLTLRAHLENLRLDGRCIR